MTLTLTGSSPRASGEGGGASGGGAGGGGAAVIAPDGGATGFAAGLAAAPLSSRAPMPDHRPPFSTISAPPNPRSSRNRYRRFREDYFRRRLDDDDAEDDGASTASPTAPGATTAAQTPADKARRRRQHIREYVRWLLPCVGGHGSYSPPTLRHDSGWDA